MATNVVIGDTYTFYTGWSPSYTDPDWPSYPYQCRVEIQWKALENPDPVNNTTTISFTGYFRSTQKSNPNLGRGVRKARIAVYSDSNRTELIGVPFEFSYGTAGVIWDGYYVANSPTATYKLQDKTLVVPHGNGTTKDIYISAEFAFGQSTYNSTSYNNAYTLPAIDRNHMVYVRDGAEWKKGKIYVHNGSQWVAPAIGASSNRGVYVWNGSEWKLGTARG